VTGLCPYKTTGTVLCKCILILSFYIWDGKTKDSELNHS
jgi:hypothetical protein